MLESRMQSRGSYKNTIKEHIRDHISEFTLQQSQTEHENNKSLKEIYYKWNREEKARTV